MKWPLITLLTSLLWYPVASHGQSAAKPAKSEETGAFKIKLSTDRAEDGSPLGFRALIDYRERQYTGVMPKTYRIRSSMPQKRFVGYHADNSCSMTVAFWPPARLKDGQKFDHDFLRWWIKEQSNDGRIGAETWSMSLGKKVPTFDVDWVTKNGLRQSTRISFVSVPDAIIEVSLMSNPDRFKSHGFSHSDLLGSLRMSGKDSKLEINPLSNKY